MFTMPKQFTVSYGGVTTVWRQDRTSHNTWHWVTTDNVTRKRLDGAEADSTSVLYQLWYHANGEGGITLHGTRY